MTNEYGNKGLVGIDYVALFHAFLTTARRKEETPVLPWLEGLRSTSRAVRNAGCAFSDTTQPPLEQ